LAAARRALSATCSYFFCSSDLQAFGVADMIPAGVGVGERPLGLGLALGDQHAQAGVGVGQPPGDLG
jgi:hypothetical protein